MVYLFPAGYVVVHTLVFKYGFKVVAMGQSIGIAVALNT